MSVTIPTAVLERYRRISRYNSPYPAHGQGAAIDLYPWDNRGISPISGTIETIQTVGCPDRSYAASTDHLIVIALDDEWCARAESQPGTMARILHVIPSIDVGDRVEVGDDLGPLTRSGFFGPWVANHLHLGFRSPGVNMLRASGSLPVSLDVEVDPISWDGTGTVVERGPTYAVLDQPIHPNPGEAFAALASDSGVPLDGGLTHYAGGGAFGVIDGPQSLRGTVVGRPNDRGLEWEPIAVRANGTQVTGLSLTAARDAGWGVKIIHPPAELRVGDAARVTIEPETNPIRLGTR